VRVVDTLTLLLVATVLFMWVIFAHPTPDERARLHDSMGASTGIAWPSLLRNRTSATCQLQIFAPASRRIVDRNPARLLGSNQTFT
jgi:hypothetical protein